MASSTFEVFQLGVWVLVAGLFGVKVGQLLKEYDWNILTVYIQYLCTTASSSDLYWLKNLCAWLLICADVSMLYGEAAIELTISIRIAGRKMNFLSETSPPPPPVQIYRRRHWSPFGLCWIKLDAVGYSVCRNNGSCSWPPTSPIHI